MKAAQTLARQLALLTRPTLRQQSPAILPCPACALLSPASTSYTQIRYASKKKTSKAQMKKSSQKAVQEEDDDEIDVEGFPVPVIAKGKKGKAAQITEEDAIEAFHLDKLEKNMDNAVERLQREIRNLVGRVERLSPALLDSVRVEEHGQRSPLQSYATVSAAGADALTVNIFDIASVKAVEAAIRENLDLNLNPQRVDETTLRVPVPRPDIQTRTQLAKKASDLAENARVSVRAARHQGQKELKADQDNKVVGEGDARKDAKSLQDATKKRTDEIDQIFAQARRVLMDE